MALFDGHLARPSLDTALPSVSDDHVRPEPFTIIVSVTTVLAIAYVLGKLF